jgi:hypothetical protein
MRPGQGPPNPVDVVADATTLVPAPNNLDETFTEFPSVPRIDAKTDLSSNRGQHRPVWNYDISEEEETRVGTTGIYTTTRTGARSRTLETAASIVGEAPGFEYYSVPGTDPPVKFDVFPGAPSPTELNGGDEVIAFKGNYTIGTQQETGVFYRPLGGTAPVELIADSTTPLPNPPPSEPGAIFGSTATPSADDGELVFVGYIEEEQPQRGGGIYRAPIAPTPTLETLVSVGDSVPGEPGETFREFGEALSFNGRSVAFWAAWGTQTRELFLACPEEGNPERVAFCNETFPKRDPSCTEDCVRGTVEEVPVHQGIFIHDTTSGQTEMISSTAESGPIDFLYWNYSGHVPEPGDTEPDAEPPRWRSSAFLAHSRIADGVVFKARTATYDASTESYEEIVDGLYLSSTATRSGPVTLVDTTSPASILDPEAQPDAIVTELGIERDGFRGRWLAITATMGVEDDEAEEEEGIAGIYATTVAGPSNRGNRRR